MKKMNYQMQYPSGSRPAILAERLRSYDDLVDVQNPDLTIITPSLNSVKYLEDTIRSVANQSFRNFEHIIIDGGSVDGTLDILKKYPHVRWISEKDNNTIEAEWKGVKRARGRYLMTCCVSDGYANTDWFKQCVGCLDQDIGISAVSGLAQVLLADGTAGGINYVDKNFDRAVLGQDSFSYCLKVNAGLNETNLCVRKNIFFKCYPPETADFGYMLDWTMFIYNFNRLGYLARFLPMVASFARRHEDALGVKLARTGLLRKTHKNYLNSMRSLRWQVILGRQKVLFRDGLDQPMAMELDRKKFIKEYALYKFSYTFLRNFAANNFLRLRRLARKCLNSLTH
jgi:glycosyltransferase involved in cell wall biosynthesis